MKTIRVNGAFNLLSIAGERNVARIQIDESSMRADYPNGRFTLLVKRQDGRIYPLAHEESEPGILTATLTGAETQYPGRLLFEVQLTDGDKLAKSNVYTGYIEASLGAEGEPPEPAEGWIAQLLGIAEQVHRDAEKVEESVTAHGYVFFDVDENGHLMMTRTENVETLDFRLNEGRLEAIYG